MSGHGCGRLLLCQVTVGSGHGCGWSLLCQVTFVSGDMRLSASTYAYSSVIHKMRGHFNDKTMNKIRIILICRDIG